MSTDPRTAISESYRAVFGSEAGKAVLSDILAHCGYDPDTLLGATSFDEVALKMAFKEGQRDVGSHLLWRLNYTPQPERLVGFQVGTN